MSKKEVLENILVTQVLTLAKVIKAEKKAKGSSSTTYYIPEAVQYIKENRSEILALLQDAHLNDNSK